MKRSSGVYTLILEVRQAITLRVGALGSLDLQQGLYLYTGSALGAGGLAARLSRHLRGDKKIFWHIDHLTSNHGATVLAIVEAEEERKVECRVNQLLISTLDATPFTGFGSSDCRESCSGHLLHVDSTELQPCVEKIRDTYIKAGLNPTGTIL